MLVQILQIGGNGWARFGCDPTDRYRFSHHAAYFNSTGLRFGNKVRRQWIVPGLIRFPGIRDFNPKFPLRSLGAVLACANLIFACGGNRVLFPRRAAHSALPGHFLAVFSNDRLGRFDCQRSGWKAVSVLPIAVANRVRNKKQGCC